MGLEVHEWLGRGLVDIVVAGEGWLPHSSPVTEFVALAEATAKAGGWSRALVLGPFEALNWSMAREIGLTELFNSVRAVLML